MFESKSTPWDEKRYAHYLESERHMYAWCLVTYGGVPETAARAQAEEFYPFEPASDPYRTLVFHDEAWHWVMLKIVGGFYWKARPELAQSSAEYRAESDRYEQSRDQG